MFPMDLGIYEALGRPGRFCSWENHCREVRAGGGPPLNSSSLLGGMNVSRTLMSSLHLSERLSSPRALFFYLFTFSQRHFLTYQYLRDKEIIS